MSDAFRVRVAMGDPQAPFEKVLAILGHYGLLKANGLLRDDVQLVSMGDHFDWGAPTERVRAAADAIELLKWFDAHPREQIVKLVGNHDLSRVGELVELDELAFLRAQVEADGIYYGPSGQERDQRERALLQHYPGIPSAEVLARDCGTFKEGHRRWVIRMLQRGDFQLAYAPRRDLLLTHAGVTIDDLDAIGVPGTVQPDAFAVAARLNDGFAEAIRAWTPGQRLILEHLHHPGDASFGEGRGILFHRPANPESDDAALFQRPWARRYDPRRLPLGVTQVIGHISDQKCRRLLGEWADDAAPAAGVLRHLQTDGANVRYSHGTSSQPSSDVATMLFTDGRMLHCEVEAYQLLDLDTGHALRR